MSLKPISLDNLSRAINKLKDYFVQIKDAVKSVNGITPDETGDILVNRVDWAGDLESSSTQTSTEDFIVRTAGGSASIKEGAAWLNFIRGNSVKTGFVQEVLEMTVNAMEREEGEPITATLNEATFKAAVSASTTITLTFTTAWSADPATYGVTVTGTPIAGDQIIIEYVKGELGTITTANPSAFVATNWNLYDNANGYARVAKYSDTLGYRIDGTYTSLAFATDPEGTTEAITVTDHLFSVPSDGYVIVTGGNSTDTAIYPTWTDWDDGYTEHSVAFSAHLEDTIDLSVIMEGDSGNNIDALFPYGLCRVGSTYDEINLNLAVAISRIDRMENTAENLATAQASGRDYDYDEDYIYLVRASAVETSLTGSYALDGNYTASDHGLEWFEDADVPVIAMTIYGSSLKNKLEHDTLTISQQTLSAMDQAQVQENLGLTVANNLTTTATGKVLDARQGKALNDSINTNTKYAIGDVIMISPVILGYAPNASSIYFYIPIPKYLGSSYGFTIDFTCGGFRLYDGTQLPAEEATITVSRTNSYCILIAFTDISPTSGTMYRAVISGNRRIYIKAGT